MEKSHILVSPAKINLFLEIGNKRSDGFHSLASIFQAISILDKISLLINKGNSIEITGNCGCSSEKNIMYVAAKAFFMAIKEKCPGITIQIEKNIPIGAGLGGGSSNAATVLKALFAMFPSRLTQKELVQVAATVGSDVPFFLSTPCAGVLGRGEQLFSMPCRTDYCIVAVFPYPGVATKEAYELLDKARLKSPAKKALEINELAKKLEQASFAYKNKAPSEWLFNNDFFEHISKERPNIATAYNMLIESGADFTSLSGSGCTVYGIFRDFQKAELAESMLSHNYDTKICFPLAYWP